MSWSPPTLATVDGASRAAQCPRCRKWTTGDMLQPFPVALGGDYGCDGCRAAAFATGAITRVDFYAALGAPADVLAALLAPLP